MKNTYTRELIQLCEQKTIHQIVKTNQYKQLVLDETCFLNILDGVTFTTRLYCIKNDIHTIPGCKKCGQPCSPKAENAKLGFNQYCSSTCSRSDKTIKKESLKFLQDYDWLYHQRITLQKSKHLIAEELEISTMPVTKWIKIHKIPEVKYNCSNPICSKLSPINTHMSEIILITDLIDLKKRKEHELEFYRKQLDELMLRMSFIQHEIKITNQIIVMIEHEKIVEIKK